MKFRFVVFFGLLSCSVSFGGPVDCSLIPDVSGQWADGGTVFKINQKECLVQLTDLTDEDGVHTWEIDLSGEQLTTVPESLIKLNEKLGGEEMGEGLRSIKIRTQVEEIKDKPMSYLVATFKSPVLFPRMGQLPFRLSTEVGGRLRIIYSLRKHNRKATSIHVKLTDAKILDITGGPLEFPKTAFIAGANFILNLLSVPIFGEGRLLNPL